MEKPIKKLHIIDNGCKNILKNRYTEETTGIIAIPMSVVPTAIGIHIA